MRDSMALGEFNVAMPANTTLVDWMDVDVRAKRKIQSGHHVVLIVQAAAAAAPTLHWMGGLRLLLKRPR